MPVEALLNEDVFVEIIADGVHVVPRVVEMVWRLKGAERVCLISDAVRPSGLPDGEYACHGRMMTVKGWQIRLADGTLAGGCLTLSDAGGFDHASRGSGFPALNRCRYINGTEEPVTDGFRIIYLHTKQEKPGNS